MAGGIFSKAINSQNTKAEQAEDGAGSYMVPTCMSCPANGCPFSADVVRSGTATCTFHAGQPRMFWDAITDEIRAFKPAWDIAMVHYQNFNDLEAADQAIQVLNSLPVIRKAGLRFVSEKEMHEAYGRGAGDQPLTTLQSLMQAKIDAAIAKVRAEKSGSSARASNAERVKALCMRIGHQPSSRRASYEEAWV